MPKGEHLKSGEIGNDTRFTSGIEAAKAGHKGGLKSQEVQRKKREEQARRKPVIEMIRQLMSSKASNDMLEYLESLGYNIEDSDKNVQSVMCASVLTKAIQEGNWVVLRDIMGMLGENAIQAEGEDENKVYRIDPLLIADGFAGLRRDVLGGRHTEYLLHGGRGSTKSSYISLQGIELLKNNPQMHWLVLRQVGNTIKDSVYNQVLWAIDMIGLSDEFEYKKSPPEITYKKTGQKIYFRGADDPLKIKSIKVPFGFIGILWFEELDQFKGEEAVRSVEQSAIRGGDVAYIFKSYNPPKTINNWANQYALIPKESRLVHTSTYKDVPAEWLGKVFIDEADYLKEINPKAYEHEYLGIPNGTGGAVFENVVIEEIPEEKIKQFDRIYRGVDWGYYPDPFHYTACYYDAARLTLYIYDEYRANKKGNRETADALINEKGVSEADELICDSAEPKSIGDYRSYGLRARGVEKGAGSVDYSMKWLQSLVKIVIDPKRCPATMNEFLNYEYERNKDDEIISGYPDANNHAIDAVRYAMSPVWKRRGK